MSKIENLIYFLEKIFKIRLVMIIVSFSFLSQKKRDYKILSFFTKIFKGIFIFPNIKDNGKKMSSKNP